MENNYAGSVKDLALIQGSASQLPVAEDVGDCPECGNPLHYTKNEKAVECPYCGRTVDVRDIKALGTVKKAEESATDVLASFAMEIDSPESALVYVENFFKKYDWNAYKTSAVIPIPEIDGIVEKHRIKYGASATSWILDFESKIIPLTKKFEMLAELEPSLSALYGNEKNPELMSKYRLYERLTVSVKESVEKIFEALQSDIEYAERFGAGIDAVTSMKLRFNNAVQFYNSSVYDFGSYKELPSVLSAKEAHNIAVANQLDAQGIDAQATYEKAVKLYNRSKNKSDALRLFEVIRNYNDSLEYINKNNIFFNFDSKLLKLSDKHFLIKQVAPPTFNVRKPQDSEENTENAPKIPVREAKPTFSLYEVIGGKAYEPAVASGISYILSYYGNKLFYIKRNRSLCCYDTFTHEETELDRGNVGDYPNEMPYSTKDGTTFYIKKKLPVFKTEYKGCFKSFFSMFKRKIPSVTDTKNNYSILKVNQVSGEVSVEIDRLVDVTEFYNERLFYIAFNMIGQNVGPKVSSAPSYMVMDLRTGKKTKVLGDDCHIHNVIGDTVIFTTWDPNEYNQMLYSYNLKTDTTTLIEANILGYFDTVGDRVYYRVGNKKYAPLFSNNFDGTDRREIMRNAKEIYAVYDGWIYFIRGKRRNTALLKMTPDGKETVLICADVSSVISISDVYVYYFDSRDNLHVVRSDGANNKIIANDIDMSDIIIDRDYIYFLRRELVGKDKNSYSLYKMDIDGSNIKKLLFNVNKIQNYDENSIYVYKCATAKYIATEYENDAIKSEKVVKHKVSTFFVFDKNEETEKLILSVGVPSEQSNVEKRGCFKRKIKHSVTYSEIPSNVPYRKEGLTRIGSVYVQQTSLDINKD